MPMHLLVLTQKVDKEDENLGFFHRWLEEFSRHTDRVTVIANAVGKISLPQNVEVYSLGKEKNGMRPMRGLKFWGLLTRYWGSADAVFFHMVPEFALAASPFLLVRPRKSVLWYVHKSVTRPLRLAERLVDFVCTASGLSFRLPSKKVLYTGHAIDTNLFKPVTLGSSTSFGKSNFNALRILTVGRISPVKDLETIIHACEVLKNIWERDWTLSVVGGPIMPRDYSYLADLKKTVQDRGLKDRIHFYGSRPFSEVPDLYREHDIFISMSTTGSIDKSVLEAMASGLTTITANEAFRSLLPVPYFVEQRSPELLAARIKLLADENRPNTALRGLVTEGHALERTIRTILNAYSRL